MEELTGEHSGAGYGRPIEVLMVLEVKDAPSWVSQLGVENDETVTAWLHIRSFKNKVVQVLDNQEDDRYVDYDSIYCKTPFDHKSWTKKIMPKPKDCFQVLTSGCDRAFDAGARIWEITNVEDELWSEKLNPSQGHYVWKITAKRYRYSFEYGMSKLDAKSANNPMLGELGEKGNHQVYENEIVKMYLATSSIVTEDKLEDIFIEGMDEKLFDEESDGEEIVQIKQTYSKKYSQAEVCDDAKKEVFDMEEHDATIYSHVDSGGFF
jgi:hypothetical protein